MNQMTINHLLLNVRPKLCLGETSVSKFAVIEGVFSKTPILFEFSRTSILTKVSRLVWMVPRMHLVDPSEFDVAIGRSMVLKGLSGWCRKTALLFTRPMITTQSAVHAMNGYTKGLPCEGCASTSRETARHGGEDSAPQKKFTSSVHRGAFFALSAPRPVRRCLRKAVRATLKELEREAAALACGNGNTVPCGSAPCGMSTTVT